MAITDEFNGNDLICTECYEIDTPDHAHYGNWPEFLLKFTLIGAVILLPTLAYLAAIFVVFAASKGKFSAIDTMELFPLVKYLPQAPYSVEICKHCKKVNSIVRIKDPEGATAIYFHKKYHVSERAADRAKKQAEQQKPEETPTQPPKTEHSTKDILERLAKDETEF